MRIFSDIWFRLRAAMGKDRMDKELVEELTFHLEMETRALIHQGMDPAEARRQANIAMGGVERYREKAREARGVQGLENLVQDIRFGVRSLKKAPLFTGVALFVLTLGIGASTAIFSVVDGVLFKPLPFPRAELIVQVFSTEPGDPRGPFSGADFLDIESQAGVFEDLAGYELKNVNLVQEVGSHRLRGASVTPAFFRVFGVNAALGRTLSPALDGPGHPSTVVLSHGLWETRFGRDAGVLGQPIELNDQIYEVVGVMPPGFDHPGVSLWTSSKHAAPDPIFESGEDPGLDRGAEYIDVVGRLREEATLREADSELAFLWSRLVQSHPETHENEGIAVLFLQDAITEDIRPTLRILLAAVGVLLLIACGNVANLTLARVTGRSEELAIRQALGAGRFRIASRLLTESVLLAGFGGIMGGLVGLWISRVLLSVAPDGIPRVEEVGMDLRLVAFAVLLSAATGAMSGLLPALRGSSETPACYGLLGRSRFAGSRHQNRTRRMLVAAEVAFSLVLIVGAGLMIRTSIALSHVDPGFQPDRTSAAHLSLPEARYATESAISGFVRRVEENIRGRPGVQSAGMVLSLPIKSGLSGDFFFSIEGRSDTEGDQTRAGYQIATPGYFETLGIPLLEGRIFSEEEGSEDPPVVVVNQALADRFWPDQEVLGQRVTWDDPEGEEVEWSTIVGIIGNSLQGGLDREPRPEIFRHYSQAPLTYMTLVARGEAGAGPMASLMRESVTDVDPRIPLYGMSTMTDLLAGSMAERRFSMILLITFASGALLLTAAGLFGVLRYGVSQRSREIGIRVALGAQTKGVMGLVVGEGLGMTGVGVVLGMALALPASRLMQSLVFEVSPGDPLTYLAGISLTAVAALVACIPPALRAARTDPLSVLKED